jgi:hypothetical protein
VSSLIIAIHKKSTRNAPEICGALLQDERDDSRDAVRACTYVDMTTSALAHLGIARLHNVTGHSRPNWRRFCVQSIRSPPEHPLVRLTRKLDDDQAHYDWGQRGVVCMLVSALLRSVP